MTTTLLPPVRQDRTHKMASRACNGRNSARLRRERSEAARAAVAPPVDNHLRQEDIVQPRAMGATIPSAPPESAEAPVPSTVDSPPPLPGDFYQTVAALARQHPIQVLQAAVELGRVGRAFELVQRVVQEVTA